MDKPGDAVSLESGSGRVLLAGDIRQAFLDTDRLSCYHCDVRANILDAIEAAAKGSYKVVGVALGGISGPLAAALTALRKSTEARIILLAQMYEEPIARRLLAGGPGELKVADGYLICPTTLASVGSLALADKTSGPGVPLVDGVASWAGQSAAQLEARIRHLEWLATTDDLTGLRNRRYIWEFARQVIERSERSAGRVTLLMFDIDNFKHYNDQYGHPAGDAILRQAAILMQRCCRPHDVVGRIGGDEFAVVFWDDPICRTGDREQDRRSAEADHPQEAIVVAKRFQNEFGRAELDLLGPEGKGVLTISGALARFPRDGRTVQELFEKADAALLEAKRSGKNRIYLVGESENDIADMT